MSKAKKNQIKNQSKQMMNKNLAVEIPTHDRNHAHTSNGVSDVCSNITNNSKVNKFSKLTPEQKIFLDRGYCNHSVLEESEIPFTDITIIHCSTCNKEMERTYG